MSLHEPGDDIWGDAVIEKEECFCFVLDEAESGVFIAFEDGDFLVREDNFRDRDHSLESTNPVR